MICPRCRGNTLVEETRKCDTMVVRRHQCKNCKKRFYSKEVVMDWNIGDALIRAYYREKYAAPKKGDNNV